MNKIDASSLPQIKLKTNLDRRFKKGHPWVFSNELEEIPKYEKGEMVSLYFNSGKLAAIGYYNPVSLISFRELVRSDLLKDDFIEERMANALKYRNGLYKEEGEARRVVYGESDRLPGLIVDFYGKTLIAQILTAGMERFRNRIIEAIDTIFKPETIILKNDSPSRILEGLEREVVIVKGSSFVSEALFLGTKYAFDIEKAQKTGLFLDQRENISLLDKFEFKGKRVLDLFSYFGSWGLRSLQLGVKEAHFVDSSNYALQIAFETAKRCGFNNFLTIEENVFDYLSRIIPEGEKYDFVFSDPPAFAKSSKHIKEAFRAYVRLNERCLRVLKRGGILIASSCSHHISYELFFDSLKESAENCGKRILLLFSGRQSLDHPILLNFPESSYLKTFFLRVE